MGLGSRPDLLFDRRGLGPALLGDLPEIAVSPWRDERLRSARRRALTRKWRPGLAIPGSNAIELLAKRIK